MNDPRKQADRLAASLVQEIITTFENPDQWPLTDEQRISKLREFYKSAKDIEYQRKQARITQMNPHLKSAEEYVRQIADASARELSQDVTGCTPRGKNGREVFLMACDLEPIILNAIAHGMTLAVEHLYANGRQSEGRAILTLRDKLTIEGLK